MESSIDDKYEKVLQCKCSAEEREDGDILEEKRTNSDMNVGEIRFAVAHVSMGYALENAGCKRIDKVGSMDDIWLWIMEEPLDISMSTSDQEKQTIRHMVAFRTQLANVHPIVNKD